MPTQPGTGPTGPAATDDAQVSFQQGVQALRKNANIRPKVSIKSTGTAKAAVRTLGTDVERGAEAVAFLLRHVAPSGLFADLGYDPDKVVALITRAKDTAFMDGAAQKLAQDVHAEAMDAREQIALLTVLVWQACQHFLQNPAVRDDLKVIVEEASAPLAAVFDSRRAFVQGRRADASLSREQAVTVEEQAARLDEYESQDEVKVAEKDLKLQFLSGEPLRPDDLVRIATPRGAATASRTSRRGSTPRRGPGPRSSGDSRRRPR